LDYLTNEERQSRWRKIVNAQKAARAENNQKVLRRRA
jgi:hypothetical protein